MKKFVKLSLAAAVASTGLVSANAGALEDAIKNTSIVGYATFRYDDRNMDDSDGANDYSQNNTKAAVVLTSKVNDDISYTYAAAFLGSSDTSTGTDAFGGVEDYNGGSIYTVYNYFTYTGFANTSVMFGTQTLATPFTNSVDVITGTQEGTGIAASTTIGGINLVAGFMNETNVAGGDQVGKVFGTKLRTALDPLNTLTDAQWANEVAGAKNEINAADLIVVQASGKVANVALNASYLTLEDSFDAFSIGAKTTIDLDGVKLSPYARYSELEFDDSDIDAALGKQKLWYVGTGIKAGMFGGSIAYGATGSNGGFVAVDTDSEAAFQGWATQINNVVEANTLKLNVNADIMTGVNVALNHITLENEEAAGKDTVETFGQLTWKPSKNFMTYLRYGVVDYDTVASDGQRGRIHVQYTF